MRETTRRRAAIAAFLFGSFLSAFSLMASPVAEDSTAVLETERLRVTLKLGAVVGIENLLTGESYVVPRQVGRSVGLLHTGGETLLLEQGRRFRQRVNQDTVSFALYFSNSRRDSITTYAAADRESGTILLWQRGGHRRRGVYGARVGVSSFDLTAGKLILPVEGGVAIDESASFVAETCDYAVDWQAQLAIFDGHVGALGIWIEDERFAPKNVMVMKDGARVSLSFESHHLGDFSERRRIATPRIRLSAYSGDWRRPAQVYREWMEQHFDPLENGARPAWVDSIACLVIHRSAEVTATLDSLASWLPPQQVLIYVPDWRAHGFDINYPDYTPAPEAVGFVAHAKKLGFRVMLHTNPYGIAPYNPEFDNFTDVHFTNPFTGEILGWLLGTGAPERHAWFNPGSAELQELFLQRVGTIVNTLAIDAIQLDVDYAAWNSDNGMIADETPGQGNRTFHRRLVETFPHMVWGGENLTEVNFYRDSFGSRWKTDTNKWRPHPVASFLFAGHAIPVGFLGFVNPDQDPELFADFMRSYESWGVLPTLDISTGDDLLGRRTHEIIRIAEVWGRLGLKPDFESDWDENTLFRLKGRRGEVAEYRRTPFGTFFVVEGDTVFNRVSGVTRVQTVRSIDGWFGYDEDELIGLDPASTYQLSSTARDLTVPHVQALSEEGVIALTSLDGEGGRFVFSHSGANTTMDLVDRLPQAQLKIRRRGRIRELGGGAFVRAEQITIGGVTRKGIATHPPFVGGTGDVLISYQLVIPDAEEARLTFFAGLAEEAQDESDGVTFFVEVDGSEILDESVNMSEWLEFSVDLSEWQGQEITLTLGNGPGRDKNANSDQARWGEVLVRSTLQPPFAAELFLPFAAEVGGSGEVSAPASNVHRIEGTLPANLYFAALETPIELPFRLLPRLAGRFGVFEDGLFLQGKSVFGSGEIHAVESGGERRVAINAHPPGDGLTIINQTLTLPEVDSLHLVGTYGIADGAQSSGVTFSVTINGEVQFSETTSDTRWQDLAVDLTRFAGRSIYLEFITDAGESPSFDRAYWADLTICSDLSGCIECVHDGDVNGDGVLSANDALCALRIYLNGQKVPAECDVRDFPCEVAAADVNCDAVVTAMDALGIFRRVLEDDTPAACFLPLAPVVRDEPVQLSLTPSHRGDLMTIALSADRAAGVRAFGVEMSYPESKVTFLGVRAEALTADWRELDARPGESGVVIVAGFNDTPLPATATGKLFELHFKLERGPVGLTDFAITGLTDDLSEANIVISGMDEVASPAEMPISFQLHQNYPNPFNPETHIRFDLPARIGAAVPVHLAVYNLAGQLVRILVDEARTAGSYEVVWDGRSANGVLVPSGLYFYQIRAQAFETTKKMVVLR